MIAISAWLVSTYAVMRGISMRDVPNATSLLITLPAIIVWIPIALLLSNCVMAVMPPLSKVAQAYARRTGTPGFLKSQFQLMGLAAILALICVPIIILGFSR